MRVKVNHPVGRELYGLPRLGFLEPLDVRLEELLDELGLGVHVVDGLRLLLVKISEKARIHAAKNPFAVFRYLLSVDEIMELSLIHI